MIDFDSVRAPFTLQRAQKVLVHLAGQSFFELNEDDKGNVYIVIHSGS